MLHWSMKHLAQLETTSTFNVLKQKHLMVIHKFFLVNILPRNNQYHFVRFSDLFWIEPHLSFIASCLYVSSNINAVIPLVWLSRNKIPIDVCFSSTASQLIISNQNIFFSIFIQSYYQFSIREMIFPFFSLTRQSIFKFSLRHYAQRKKKDT